jgi:hypothetical protein
VLMMRIALCLAALFAGCAPRPWVLQRAVDLEPRDGTRVLIAGIYEPVAVPPEEGTPPAHLGHVLLRVEGVPIRLGLHPRPLEEITQFRGSMIAVVGMLSLRPPPEEAPKDWQKLPRPVLHVMSVLVPFAR